MTAAHGNSIGEFHMRVREQYICASVCMVVYARLFIFEAELVNGIHEYYILNSWNPFYSYLTTLHRLFKRGDS